MVKIDIGFNPELTEQAVLNILQQHLPYKVEMWKAIGSGVSVWKNVLLGAIVKLKQGSNTTILSVEGNPPSLIMRLVCCVFGFICGLIVLFLLSGNFAGKVAEEIRKIPQFQK
ncbi:MAG: hypothetical protein JW776_09430 [Candidatus Lokiarchaeota archaeon]|nr:hypothetical protein [Candidatus Lokiarchaeota archaeon]